MIVMKFGGSSVANAERILQVIQIVKGRLKRKPVVVSSALKGVTDALFQAGKEALRGPEHGLDKIREKHRECLRALELPEDLLDGVFAELEVLLKGITLIKELTPRTLDYVVSFGERLSTRIIAARLTKEGVPAEQHDSFDIGLITNDDHGNAQPLPEAYEGIKRHVAQMKDLPVITGYLGKTAGGDITTLGRNGSDLSATLIGAAIGAEEIEIWSDVDGIMTADPRVVKGARAISELTFGEASELAYYGGKVLHPATLVPAIQKRVPVRCLNTFKPDQPGTAIVAEATTQAEGARSIAHNLHNLTLTVTTPRMLQGYGFLSRIFDVLSRHRISVDMISTSEVSVSVTLDSHRGLDAAVAELKEFAEVSVEPDRSIVCVVGEGLRTAPDTPGNVFEALREAGVNVLMISQGASKINLAFVVDDAECPKAVQALHRKFFGA